MKRNEPCIGARTAESAPLFIRLARGGLGGPRSYARFKGRGSGASANPVRPIPKHSLKFFCCLVLLATIAVAGAFGQSAAVQDAKSLAARLDEHFPALEKLYRELHAHPELSFREEQTSRRIADELNSLGFKVTPHVGRMGVVGVLENGAGPTLLVRTDLDALPVKEQTGLPYASQVRTTNDTGEVDVMHACGHDMHMTVFIGTAKMLVSLKDRWRGTVIMIGQPAEERGGGAKAMLDDGLFTRFPQPNHCLALHVNAEMPAGTVGLTEGYSMANVDTVDVTIRGVGGHGAWPHKTKDPIVLAAQTVLALQTIISRERDPLDPAVVTIGSIHGGTKHNIISDEVRLQLTVRSFSDEVRRQILDSIARIIRGQAIAAGIPEDRMPTMKISDEFTPAEYNDPALTGRLHELFQKVFGEKRVMKRKPGMGGEDFSQYGRTAAKIPLCMFWLGSVEPALVEESERTGKPLPSLHSGLYHPLPEPTIRTGVTAMTAAVLELIGRN